MRRKAILWSALLLSGFLLGFVPQFLSVRRTEDELRSARRDLDSCRLTMELARVRDLAARIYLETSRKNFGTASEHASRFFDEVRSLAQRTEDARLKSSLEELLARRDGITASLAAAEAPALQEAQTLLLLTQQDIRPADEASRQAPDAR